MTHQHILLKLNDGIFDTKPEVVNEVKRLQQTLKDWGTLAANESIDGKFGPKTDEAVKRFQGKHSLTQDGIRETLSHTGWYSGSKYLGGTLESATIRNRYYPSPQWWPRSGEFTIFRK